MVCGSLVNLYNFVQPLRSRTVGNLRPIVFLSRRPPPANEWEKISHFSQVYYVEGTPLSRYDLIKAGTHAGTWEGLCFDVLRSPRIPNLL